MNRREFLQSVAAYALSTNYEKIHAMACDGKYIVIGVGSKTRIFNSNLKCMATYEGHSDRVESVAIKGKRVASGSLNGTLLEWVSGRLRRERHDHAIFALEYHGNSLCHGGYCETVQVGKDRMNLPCKDIRAIHSCGETITAGGKSNSLFSLVGGKPTTQKIKGQDVTCLTSCGNTVVWGGSRGMIGTFKDSENVVKGNVSSICAISKNAVAVGSTSNEVAIVDTRTFTVKKRIDEATGTVSGLACIGSTLYAASWDGALRTYNISGVK